MLLNWFHHCKPVLLLVFLFVVTLAAATLLNNYPSFHPLSILIRPATASVVATGTLVNVETVKIHIYTSPPMDEVNLYWLETDAGIVIVDTGRFLSQARYALAEMRATSDKPIIGILITHPHTDHYGGLPVFVEAAGKDVPIYASQATTDDIRTDGQGFIQARKQLHGNDFPTRSEIPLPNRIVQDGEEIRFGNLVLRVIELPQNETINTTLYYLREQEALFAGDLATNKTIPFLADGYSGNWLAQLRMLPQQYPNLKTVYSGHGEPGSAKELLQAQVTYIETLRSLVTAALASGSQVTLEEKANIVAEIKQRYPDYQTSLLLPDLLERGIDGVAQELEAKK